MHRSLQEDVLPLGGTKWPRLRHQLGLDRNPLRRRSDRIESLFLLFLIVGFIPLAAFVTILVAGWTRSAGVGEQRAGAALTQVTAVLLKSVPMARPPVSLWMSAPARWEAYGRAHMGLVPAVRGSQPGARIPIWVDRSGIPRPPAPTTGEIAARVAMVTVLTPPLVAFCLWVAWRSLRRVLDRRRMAAWGRAWSVVGPRWTWHR